ncbi:tRNA1(Val) (adenine(37)-N6)-methyltransferase [Rhodopila sp.]|uniref:tRNA1(Val) (adenine(37)-N6)-methyltransferase n=1 Tax=Rhodopila sp. TaxID=2480087 RepID=UPI002C53A976|nr:methyltransferase [Rhodopila sp.]HVZ09227.1 methyltransferase [Rhodopila sp.]
MLTTEGHLLGGRLRYGQPKGGFRSGIEPVLLAASVPAAGGEHVLEGGTGSGAALLCLRARIPTLVLAGIEIDAELAALARHNAAANGFRDISVITGDLLSTPLPGPCDHALANPPYHGPGTPSPLPERERAKRGAGELIAAWIARLVGCLRNRGSLTLILPAAAVPGALAAMDAAECAATILFPLWPKTGRDAKLVLLRGVKGSRAPIRVAAGLVLHGPDGAFTSTVDAVLRDGAPLDLG